MKKRIISILTVIPAILFILSCRPDPIRMVSIELHTSGGATPSDYAVHIDDDTNDANGYSVMLTGTFPAGTDAINVIAQAPASGSYYIYAAIRGMSATLPSFTSDAGSFNGDFFGLYNIGGYAPVPPAPNAYIPEQGSASFYILCPQDGP